MMKKGDLALDTVGKLIIGVVFLLLIILALYLFKEKMYALLESMKRVLRFGA